MNKQIDRSKETQTHIQPHNPMQIQNYIAPNTHNKTNM